MSARSTRSPMPNTHGSLDAHAEVGGFLLTETTHAPGVRLAPHAHVDPAVSLVLAGGFREAFRRDAYDCVPGGLLIKPPGERHANAYGPRGARSLLIDARCVSEARWQQIAPVFEGVRYLPGGEPNRLARRIARLLRELDDTGRLAAEGMLLEMFAAVSGARPDALRDGDPPWLRRAVEALHASRANAPGLEALARTAGVSPSTLARAFRRRFGVSPGGFLRRLRVEWAREQLVRTDRSLAVIAAEAGFADQSHFTRVFARATGVTPARLRRGAR